ncbi:Chaperone J-domain containing protein [Gracilaria domingensis]|nr:Chaperone J-domain containing protein [Gracilaria domingensis]
MEGFIPCHSSFPSHTLKLSTSNQSTCTRRGVVWAEHGVNCRRKLKSSLRSVEKEDRDPTYASFSDYRSQVDKLVRRLADVKNRYERISDEVRTLQELPDDYILGSDISKLFIGSTSTVQDLPLPEAPSFHGLTPREVLTIAEGYVADTGMPAEVQKSLMKALNETLICLRNWISAIKEEAKLIVAAHEEMEVKDDSASIQAFASLLQLARFSIMPALPSVDEPPSPELIPLGTSKETTLDPSLIVKHDVLRKVIREQKCDLGKESFYPYVFVATRGVSVVRNSGLLLSLKLRAIERSYLGWIAVPFTILLKPSQVFDWFKTSLSKLTMTLQGRVTDELGDNVLDRDRDDRDCEKPLSRAVRRIVPAVRLKSLPDAIRSLFFPSFTQEPCHELFVLMYREVEQDKKVLQKGKRSALLKQVRETFSQAVDPFAAMKAKQGQKERGVVAGPKIEDFAYSIRKMKPVCLHLYKDVPWGLKEHYFPSIYVLPATGDLLRLDAITLFGLISAAVTYVRHSDSWFSYAFLLGSLVSYVVRVASGWRRALTEYKEKIASDKVTNTVAQQWAVIDALGTLAVEEAFAQVAAVFLALRQGDGKSAIEVEQEMYSNVSLDATSSKRWEKWLFPIYLSGIEGLGPPSVLRELCSEMDEEGKRLYRAVGFDPGLQNVLLLTQKDIARGYRQQALKWHPDRNRNDPTASKKFTEIFLAYETLSSSESRKKYDDAIAAARKHQERLNRMDSVRRRFREALEREEKEGLPAGRNSSPLSEDALQRVQKEIERLRREASGPAHNGGQLQNADVKSSGSTAVDAGPWAEVPGYTDFREAGLSSFEDFERDVLNRKIPF